MQMAVIEYARNVLGIKDATSREFFKTGSFVVGFMNEWLKTAKRIKQF